jgi:hypothetical protein
VQLADLESSGGSTTAPIPGHQSVHNDNSVDNSIHITGDFGADHAKLFNTMQKAQISRFHSIAGGLPPTATI